MSKEAVLDAWFAAYNAHDVRALCRLAHPGIELSPLGGSQTAPPGATYHGHEGLRSLIEPGYERWPALRVDRGVTLEEGGHFVVDVLFVLDDGAGEPTRRSAKCVYEVSGPHIRRIAAYE